MFYDFIGTTAPTITPTALNQIYQDTVAKVLYFSVGTSSSADWKQVLLVGDSEPLNIAVITSSMSVTNQDIIKTLGTNVINITLPSAVGFVKTISFNHSGTQDLTIAGVSGALINNQSNLQLRGNHINAVTLFSDGSNWWVL